MTATSIHRPVRVHTTASRGTTFHNDPGCMMLRSGQDLADNDCPEGCLHQHRQPRRVRELPTDAALAEGKWPCTYCYPGRTGALMIPPCEEDFGHQPYEYDGAIICMRCYTVTKGRHEAVYWPCTSALILGIAPRAMVLS